MIKRQPRAELGCLTGMFFLGAVMFSFLQLAHQLSPVPGECGLWFIADLGMTAFAALFGAAIGRAAGSLKSLGRSVLVGCMLPTLFMLPIVAMQIWIGEPVTNVVERIQFFGVVTVAAGLCAVVSHVVAGMFRSSHVPVEDDDRPVVHPTDR